MPLEHTRLFRLAEKHERASQRASDREAESVMRSYTLPFQLPLLRDRYTAHVPSARFLEAVYGIHPGAPVLLIDPPHPCTCPSNSGKARRKVTDSLSKAS